MVTLYTLGFYLGILSMETVVQVQSHLLGPESSPAPPLYLMPQHLLFTSRVPLSHLDLKSHPCFLGKGLFVSCGTWLLFVTGHRQQSQA